MDAGAFITSNQAFQYTIEIPENATVCIVDSSFNPPNLAHKKLADLCLGRFPGCYILFMLATGNADKPSVDTESLQHRVNMMELMVKHEYSNNTKVGTALITMPRFIEKADVVKAALPTNEIVFAMGYDTLLRLGMQQYYSEPVSDVLKHFFSKTSVLVLAREEDGVSKTPAMEEASKQLESINKKDSFSAFIKQIFIEPAGKDTFGVCSSAARKSKDGLYHNSPVAVADYAIKHNLYNI